MDHYFLTLINWGGPLRTIQRLKAECDEALSNCAFKFKVCRYTKAAVLALDLPPKTETVVGQCRLTASKLVLKAPTVSALEAKI
jgi:hypothetical protein